MASPEKKIRFGGWSATDWAESRARINRVAFSDEGVPPRRKKKRGNERCKGVGHNLVLVPPTSKPDYERDSKVQYWANLFNKPLFSTRADVFVCSRCGKVKIKHEVQKKRPQE